VMQKNFCFCLYLSFFH